MWYERWWEWFIIYFTKKALSNQTNCSDPIWFVCVKSFIYELAASLLASISNHHEKGVYGVYREDFYSITLNNIFGLNLSRLVVHSVCFLSHNDPLQTDALPTLWNILLATDSTRYDAIRVILNPVRQVT